MPNLLGSAGLSHTHTSPPLGFIVERLITSKTHRFRINNKVTKTKTHKWNRTQLVTGSPKTKTHKYNIVKRVLQTKTHRFNSGGKVRKFKTHRWNLTKKVTRTHTHKFSIKIKIPRTHTHKWNIIGRIFRTHTHKWNSGGKVKNIFRIHKYNIKKRVAPTKTHKWNILTPIILESELQYYKSTNSNSTGGVINTSSPVLTDTKHNLFDVVSASESSSGDIEYRCLYVRNNSLASILQNSKIWIVSNTLSTTTDITIGLGTSAVNGTEQTIANENTAPSGVTFSNPTTLATALSIGNLTAGQHKAVWLRRTINTASQAITDDNIVLAFAGDTVASN